MEMQPVNLTEVLGVVLGLSTVLIPIAGFTLRFALRPFAEALIQARSRGPSRDEIALLEKRLALLERELDVRRLPPPESERVGVRIASLPGVERT